MGKWTSWTVSLENDLKFSKRDFFRRKLKGTQERIVIYIRSSERKWEAQLLPGSLCWSFFRGEMSCGAQGGLQKPVVL